MKDSAFLDSNIFLYAFDARDVEKQNISREILFNKQNKFISLQVINEVSNNLLRKFKLNNKMIAKYIKSAYSRYEVLDINEEVFLFACNLRDDYNLSYYDSLIVSVAFLSGCSILYSEDMQNGLIIYRRLKIINPYEN